MASLKHPEFGHIKYSAIYFKLDEPIMFTCYFNNSEDKYVGVMVEDFEANKHKVQSWYFVGVAENEVRMLETTPGKLKELFESRPVWWCNRTNGSITWKKQNGISAIYQFCDRSTLS